mgnify:CR=1 FL=1
MVNHEEYADRQSVSINTDLPSSPCFVYDSQELIEEASGKILDLAPEWLGVRGTELGVRA